METVAKEVTVEVRGYLLGAFAPMTLVPIVVGREARSEQGYTSSARKKERKWVRSLLLSPVRGMSESGHLEVLIMIYEILYVCLAVCLARYYPMKQ